MTLDPPEIAAPLAWLSGTFKTAERHWHPTHHEMFALVAVLRQHPEIFGSRAPIHVRTDSEHLVRWSQLDISCERLAHWNETFVKHNLRFEHLAGIDNVVANAHSRSVRENNAGWEGKVIPADALAPIRLVGTGEWPALLCDSIWDAVARKVDFASTFAAAASPNWTLPVQRN